MNKYCTVILLSFALVLLSSGCSKKFKMSDEQISIQSDWAFYRHDINSLGSRSGSFNGNLDILWERSTGTKPAGPLTLGNGFLIYPGSRKKIKLFEVTSGHYRGYVRSKARAQSGMIISDSLGIFVEGPRKNRVRCINLLNKKILWERRVRDATPGLLIVNSMLILSSASGAVLAFDLNTGETAWSYKAAERLAAPLSFQDSLLFQPGDKGTLFVLRADDGTELYTKNLGEPLLSAAAVSESVYLADMTGNIYSLSIDSGAILWQTNLSVPVWGAPAVAGRSVYVASTAGKLFALDAAGGRVLWTFDPGFVFRSAPIVVGDYVLAGTMTGKLYCLNAADGSLVSQREFSGAVNVAPVTDGEFIYVATSRGELLCLGDKGAVLTSER